MTHKEVNVKAGHPVASAKWPLADAFIYQSAIWKIKGLYLSAGPPGARELWWIVGEQPHDEMDGGGER